MYLCYDGKMCAKKIVWYEGQSMRMSLQKNNILSCTDQGVFFMLLSISPLNDHNFLY